VACDSNIDCQSDEVCTPLLAWRAGIGCGVAQVDEEDCSVAVYQCARVGAFCTVAEGLPEPCTSDGGDYEFTQMVHMLVGRVPSSMAPEVRLPILLCIQRYNTAHPAANYGDICYRQTDCDETCRSECEGWYTADPEAAYDVLISVLLEDDLGLTVTPIARAMELLPQ
jgi:hypothetical protein